MTTTRFLLPAMDCPTEKEIVSNRLRKMSDVEGLDFDLLDRIVTVRHREGADQRVEAAKAWIRSTSVETRMDPDERLPAVAA